LLELDSRAYPASIHDKKQAAFGQIDTSVDLNPTTIENKRLA
jgi:hypothetical protein